MNNNKRKRCDNDNDIIKLNNKLVSNSDSSGDASEEDNNNPLTPTSPNSSNKFYTNNDSEVSPTKRPKVTDNDNNDDEITSSPTSPFSPNMSDSDIIEIEKNISQLSEQYSFKINPPPTDRPIRIYCDGIYDLFHFGHAKALKQAKMAFPNVCLLVGACDDEITHKKKGKTVLNEFERVESLRHCKWVDEVIEHAPWTIDQEFLDLHRIDYVAHDEIPYASDDCPDVYAFVKSQGKFLPIQRTEGVSTSDLITRIVRDYDQYVRRNLERGVSAKELNIGFLKEKEIHMKKSISDIRTSIHQNWHGTRVELSNNFSELKHDLAQTFTEWEERSQEFVRGFAGKFGAESVVDKIFRRRSRGTLTNGSEEESNRNGSSEEDPLHRSRSVSPVRRVISFIKRDKQ
ncbi:hypothetical protein Glove_508g66 [Diversispora epigaea]|uniref:choline-phosphate cytidylyltransferase n=1 Tax=Diversispora epigaea TaxID=1348612 RepID=A0A397GIH8_9GLOM|nr:hypothetical protein Glove_508g66 [Diversispora epigaea]